MSGYDQIDTSPQMNPGPEEGYNNHLKLKKCIDLLESRIDRLESQSIRIGKIEGKPEPTRPMGAFLGGGHVFKPGLGKK